VNELKCKICGRQPHEIEEYIEYANVENTTPEQAVIEDEGTYNPETGLFYCTDCYIKIGMPSGKA
jgi:hypothetical protein